MTTIEELVSRVSQLEETVSHLSTHHDEQFLMVHDDMSADTCDRLFNVNLRNAQSTQHHATTKRRDRTARRKKRVVTVKRKRT
jgi:Rps23 Pro-64 3,4-dihydroxylase Tpa1-like proline 4-hydroxylase